MGLKGTSSTDYRKLVKDGHTFSKQWGRRSLSTKMRDRIVQLSGTPTWYAVNIFRGVSCLQVSKSRHARLTWFCNETNKAVKHGYMSALERSALLHIYDCAKLIQGKKA